ncbi:MAG TPA: hypothetical protein VFD45_03580 [Patescibacteria group bacterium]|nr:hypothetical protein [Patescibacteria group bacterium]
MNKKYLIPLIAAISLILVGGAVYLFSQRNSSNQASLIEPTMEVIPTIMPSDIGLTLTPGADGKRLYMEITNTKDIAGVDYELSYTTTDDIPRGAIGHVDIKTPGQKIKQEIILGTCSDVCHYDKDITNIKLIVKVTKTNGMVYQAEVETEL